MEFAVCAFKEIRKLLAVWETLTAAQKTDRLDASKQWQEERMA